MRQGDDDGLSYGWQRWLRRASGDSFSPVGAGPLFPLACSGQATMLEEGVGDHCQKRVAVKAPCSGTTFEVVEAKFFLEPLVSLLADPARLDRRGEYLGTGVGRQPAEMHT